MPEQPPLPLQFKGIAVSPGIQIGRVITHNPRLAALGPRSVHPRQVEREIERFHDSLSRARGEITELRERVRAAVDETHASIFDPHLMLIEDPALVEQTIARIRGRHESAAFALMGVIERFAEQFRRIQDEYIASRASDLFDVGHRICKHLTVQEAARRTTPVRPSASGSEVIVFAHDLAPSDTAQMEQLQIKAFALEAGGLTSHTAILAKALQIPAVFGLGPIMSLVQGEAVAIIDGYEGTVTLHPTAQQIKQARQRRRRRLIQERDFRKLRDLPAETIDGYRVRLSANLELPAEIAHAAPFGAEGVGLFRTEFLYLNRIDLPGEDEQFELYRSVLQAVAPHEVIFRTLDIGGDKLAFGLGAGREANPFLGQRAIRYCLEHPDLFRIQLRAMLRASAHGRAKIMFPMVSGVEEVLAVKRILAEVKAELACEERPFDRRIELGVMIEIPSAALTADRLAEEVDFFSIGTNDLIQYTLAVDRSNEKVASLYDPFHPAVLSLIRRVIDVARRRGIWMSVCGEMAANPMTALLLVGMGIDELSMGAPAIPQIKYFLRQIRLQEARRIAQEIQPMTCAARIKSHVTEAYEKFERHRINRGKGEAAEPVDSVLVRSADE